MLADVQQILLAEMSDGVYAVDRDRCITYWSPAAEVITGYSAAEVVGRSCADGILRHVSDSGQQLCIVGCPLAAVMKDGHRRAANIYLHHKSGHRVPVAVKGHAILDDAGQIVGSLELFHPRATNRFSDHPEGNRAEDAYVDSLTGLANRRFGETQLQSLMAGVDAGVTTLGVLFVDVDHFKDVNDSQGHGVGDIVLRMVGQSLANGVRADDFPIRWGGEEFLVLLPGAAQVALERTAERLRMLVEHSWFQNGDSQVRVTVSIGATLARPEDTVLEVVDRADRLMYQSKAAGRNLVTGDDGPLARPAGRPLEGNLAPWKMPPRAV